MTKFGLTEQNCTQLQSMMDKSHPTVSLTGMKYTPPSYIVTKSMTDEPVQHLKLHKSGATNIDA